jgi:hypothetical protein
MKNFGKKLSHEIFGDAHSTVNLLAHETGLSVKTLLIIVGGCVVFTGSMSFARAIVWGYARARRGGYRSNYRAELAKQRARKDAAGETK